MDTGCIYLPHLTIQPMHHNTTVSRCPLPCSNHLFAFGGRGICVGASVEVLLAVGGAPVTNERARQHQQSKGRLAVTVRLGALPRRLPMYATSIVAAWLFA
eukprot:364254-Chlamydomonas_euryale.AAC.2